MAPSQNPLSPFHGVQQMQTRFLLGAALVALFAAACGQGPDLIDRTQPNYIRKSELQAGEWYVMDTVVDVPPTSPLAFVGQQGQMDKVRFEVLEDMLVAYRSYEFVPGTDPLVDTEKSRIGKTVYRDGTPYRGSPYGAWRIQSHFDRQRQYNAATGEQSNVLVEDQQDRPWYQREFIRVDWSRNLISNLTLADQSAGRTAQRGYFVQPIDQDPGDDAFTLAYAPDEQQADGTVKKGALSYLDFTVKAIAQPPTYDYPGYGPIPYCWLNPRVDCEAAELKFRYSFKRVDTARVMDYEPLVYNDKMMTKFGYFRTERITYDRNRGVTDSGRLLFADRHNLWTKWHDASGDLIPVESRNLGELRPVVYHLTQGFPKELMSGVRDIEASWDKAFRRAVAVPMAMEINQVPQMFYLCENPVPANAPKACGAEGTAARIGDIRFNMLAWVADPMLAGPLGYGPHGADPETGEIVQAGAYIYGAGIDSWSGDAQQVMELLTGDLSLNDLLAGKSARDFVSQHYNATDPRRASGPATASAPLTVQEQRSPESFRNASPKLRGMIDAWKRDGRPPLALQDRRAVVDQLIGSNPALASEMVDGPEVRAAVMAAAPGEKARARLASDPSFYRTVARQTMLRLKDLESLERERVDRASRGNIWLAEFSDDQFYGMAKDLSAKFHAKVAELQASGKSADSARTEAKGWAWNTLRNAALRSVSEHEVGHTLGLMHNFQGSFDALNYHDDYWDLRKDTIGVVVDGKRQLPVTAEQLTAANKQTQAQVDGRMDEYAYSSIMDYGSRMNADIHGIGKYDEAAILFAYSGAGVPGYVEVFNQTRAVLEYDAAGNPVGTQPSSYTEQSFTEWPTSYTFQNNQGRTETYNVPVRGAHTLFPLAQVTHYTPVTELVSDRFHYTTLPLMFADADRTDLVDATEQGLVRMRQRSFKKWSEIEPVYKAIDTAYRDFNAKYRGAFYSDKETAAQVLAPVFQSYGVIPVEVPYMYCSDYEVGSNLTCNRWDRGADVYEMTSDWMNRYQQYYWFANFKRDRYDWGPNNVFQRNYSRYMANFPNVYQHWVFNMFWNAFYGGWDYQTFDSVGVADVVYQNYWTMAVVDSTNLLLKTMATPAAGYVAKETGTNNWVHVPVANNTRDVRLPAETETQLKADLVTSGKYSDVAYLPRGEGRSMFTLYEHDGYDFFRRPVEVGHFWDQYAAMVAITSSETNFLGVDRGSDALRYSLPYYITFPKDLTKVFSGIWTGETGSFAAGITPTGDGLATTSLPDTLHAQDYITGFEYPVATGAAAADKVSPSSPWSTRFYAQLFGMAFFTENFNQEFAMQNQVFRVGTGESLTPAQGYEVVSFADPFGGGYKYAALSPTAGSGVPGEETPAAAPVMVRKAIAAKDAWDAAKADADADPSSGSKAAAAAEAEGRVRESVRSLEIMRGLYGVFSRTW